MKSANEIWDECLGYGARNRCSIELAIESVFSDNNYPSELRKDVYKLMSEWWSK